MVWRSEERGRGMVSMRRGWGSFGEVEEEVEEEEEKVEEELEAW